MNLQKYTDELLLAETKTMVKKEREITHLVLLHLSEVERRKLYSDLKYRSLFDYCMQELGYSEDEACRRISAMRFIKRNPEVNSHIEKNELTLSSLNLLDQFQKKSGADIRPIMSEVAHKSKREVEAILKSKLSPAPAQETTRIHLSLKTATVEKLSRIKGIIAHKKPNATTEELIDLLCEKFLNDHEEKLKPKRQTKTSISTTRYIPKATRASAYKATDGKCANCGSTYQLEFNHLAPYAKGGVAKVGTINLLCKNCNLRAMVNDYGEYGLKFR